MNKVRLYHPDMPSLSHSKWVVDFEREGSKTHPAKDSSNAATTTRRGLQKGKDPKQPTATAILRKFHWQQRFTLAAIRR
jgi:hypothetical protein